jgi:signal peptidase I
MKFHISKKIAFGLSVAVIAVVVFLPFYMGTKTYPMAIVQGNSMYPALQSGDIVMFKAVGQKRIENGTVIVFVQSDTGVTMLDSLLKPIVIHRVVGALVQGDGTICYTTKGDNNGLNDPSVVEADHVLGTPLLVIPKVGLLLLFMISPQGLVATIGVITLLYLGSYEWKLNEEREKEAFLGDLARLVLDGELSEETFKKFEFAVKYMSGKESAAIKDGSTQALLDWMKKGGLKKGWKINKVKCPDCSSMTNGFESPHNLTLFICPHCIEEAQDEGLSASEWLQNLVVKELKGREKKTKF